MKKGIILSVVLSIFLISGCGDDFLTKSDSTSLNSGNFFQTETDAIAAVNSAYAPLQNLSLWARRIHFLLDFSSDEIGPTPNTQGAPFELLQHTFGPIGNEHIDNPFQMFYKVIQKANFALKGIDGSDIDQDVKDETMGQAYFLRGLAYLYMNAIWNGVPLRTYELENELGGLGRATPEEVWTQVENDLNLAADLLPATWPASEAGRATSGAALSLLGRAHVYQGEWAQAETVLDQVINSGVYALEGTAAAGNEATTIEEAIAAMRRNHDWGVKNNIESIFEVQFASGLGGLSWNSNAATNRQESTIRPHEYGVNGKSFYNCKPSDKLIEAFETLSPGNPDFDDIDKIDPRFQAFFFTKYDTVDVGGQVQPYSNILAGSGYAWKKYQDGLIVSTGNDNDVNHDVIRYADVILMAAEAKIMQNEVSDGIDLINEIRRRADPTGTILPDRPNGASQSEAMEFLKHERQVELCGEQVRRFDLVRWGDAAAEITNFQVGKHEYFPIPQTEINNNPALTDADQNPGYN